MSNPNYNKQTTPAYANKGAGGYKYPKGVKLPGSMTEKDGPYPKTYPVVGKVKKGL